MRHHEGFLSWDGRQREVVFTRDGSHDLAIDTAYAAKYGNGSATRAITNALSTETTLRVDPR